MDRILSIQSHVAYGYVGGKAAVFPLQCLGYDVDVINTVNFSNHSGYGKFGGSRTTASELRETIRVMDENEFLHPSRLLTGYIPGAEALSAIKEVAEKLKQQDAHLIYLLDPVLGDSGRLYVAPDVIPIYREMLPLATIITPNWFEVETLTETKIQDVPSLRQALKILHTVYSVAHVVISSIPLKPWLTSALPSTITHDITPFSSQEYLLCVCSSKIADDGISSIQACAVPCLPGYFSGVGDLFSALVLAHFDPTHSPAQPSVTDTALSIATSLALTKTHAILSSTYQHVQNLPEQDRTITDDELDSLDPTRKIRRMKGRELRIIQGQDLLRKGKDGTYESFRLMKPWVNFWT